MIFFYYYFQNSVKRCLDWETQINSLTFDSHFNVIFLIFYNLEVLWCFSYEFFSLNLQNAGKTGVLGVTTHVNHQGQQSIIT